MASKNGEVEPRSEPESPLPSPESEEDVPKKKKGKSKPRVTRTVKSDVMHRRSREGEPQLRRLLALLSIRDMSQQWPFVTSLLTCSHRLLYLQSQKEEGMFEISYTDRGAC